MLKHESIWAKRMRRQLGPRHLKNQIPDSLLGYDNNGTPVVIEGGSGITISGGVISAGGGGGGTVTSVGMTTPTGLSVAGSPITTAGTLAVTYASGYSIPTDLKQTDWDTAFGWGNHASAGYATTTYVDNLIDGLKWKQSVKVATTGNITLSGEQTIDGVLTSANRVLVWQQSTPSENGIWVSAAGAWTRAADASTGTELVSAAVNVEAGGTYADIEFVNTNNSINLGVDNITFVTRASTTNHNNLSGLQGGTTNQYYHLTAAEHGIATAPTLANISSFSNNASKSLYTMTSTIPVEFRTSGGSALLYLDETNARVGIGITTPSAQLSVTRNNIGVTQDNAYGLLLANNTPATAGNQQQSPPARWRGFGWKTTATAASQSVDFLADVLPIQGTSSPIGVWQLKSSINGAAYSNILSVNSSGFIAIGGSNDISPIFYAVSNDAGTIDLSGMNLSFYSYNVSSHTNAAAGAFNFTGRAYNYSSGTQSNVQVSKGFSPTSGTGTFSGINILNVINQTGGANGVTRGIYVTPTLTAAADWRSVETNNNTGWAFYGAGTANSYFGGNVGIGTVGPTRRLSVQVSGAITNAVTYAQRLTHITSGTATTGFGTGVEYELENASGTNRVAATEEITWSDATDATEDATWKLRLIRAGTLTDAITVTSTGATTIDGLTTINSNLVITSSGAFQFLSRSRIQSPQDGVISLYNNGASDFNRLQFGGTTSSFPALKRSSSELQVRLADDSGFANILAKAGTFSGRLNQQLGANIASANDLTLGTDGNVFHITGTTTINAITTAGWGAGEIILIFDDNVTVKNNTAGGAGTASMLLAGGVDFNATVNDVLKLVFDGARFYEVSRSVN